MIVIKLENKIDTGFSGYKQLTNFYHTACTFTNEIISIDFYGLDFLDANMSALFLAMLHKLNKENNLNFSTDLEFVENKFDVLLRNGFIPSHKTYSNKACTTMPSVSFESNDKNGFIKYIEDKLLDHIGMPPLTKGFRIQITDDLIEIFSNINFHANTTEPFFVCGQYYPKSTCLKFTMVDLGEGFLPKIKIATNAKVNNSLDAIKWALDGNSTKTKLENVPGGLGISRIYKYCLENNGVLQIISGDAFWGTDLANTVFADGRILPAPFVGTTINLLFKHS